MTKTLTVVGLLIAAAGAAATVVADPVVFTQVDVFVQDGDDKKRRDARLELDPDTRTLTLADEKRGIEKATYAVVPYVQITRIVLEESVQRAIMLWPPFYTKGWKHVLTIEAAGLPRGAVSAQLHDDNYDEILAALRAATGLEIEEIFNN